MIINLGGAGGLDFHVVGGTTRPTNPENNTIWVNTNSTISTIVVYAYTLDAVYSVEGMIAIIDDANKWRSPDMNIAKDKEKLYLPIFPKRVYQYVGGVWVRKTASMYKNGQWTDFYTWLYQDGTNFTNITGGWKTAGVNANSNWTAKAPSIAYNSTNMKLTLSENGHLVSGIVYTANKIDLTHINKIHFKGSTTGEATYMRRLAVFSSASYAGIVAEVYGLANGTVLDVSALSGSYHIGFYLGAGGAYNEGTVTYTITCTGLYMD